MLNDFDLSKITGDEGPTLDPNKCPVCDEVDDDGLEACASCYNALIASESRYRNAYKLKCEELHHLRLECIKIEVELLKWKGRTI